MSFWKFFRIIFVIFSLYLLGDAFYRWDGFRYYASFSEFLPVVALALILWSLVAILVTILVWLLFKAFEWFCQLLKLRIRSEYLLLCSGIFVLLGALAWKGKRLILPYAQTSLK